MVCGNRFAVLAKTGWEYEQKKLTNSLNAKKSAKNTYEYTVLLFFYSYGSATRNGMCESPHDSFGNNRKNCQPPSSHYRGDFTGIPLIRNEKSAFANKTFLFERTQTCLRCWTKPIKQISTTISKLARPFIKSDGFCNKYCRNERTKDCIQRVETHVCSQFI